jgi:hypothetical protein
MIADKLKNGKQQKNGWESDTLPCRFLIHDHKSSLNMLFFPGFSRNKS